MPRAKPDGGLDLSDITAAAIEKKIAWLQEAAGPRLTDLEIKILIQFVEPDVTVAESHAEDLGITLDQMLSVPFELFGDRWQISDTLMQRRELFGISYIVIFEKALDAFAPVVAALRGR